jgi:hypothetical protein
LTGSGDEEERLTLVADDGEGPGGGGGRGGGVEAVGEVGHILVSIGELVT